MIAFVNLSFGPLSYVYIYIYIHIHSSIVWDTSIHHQKCLVKLWRFNQRAGIMGMIGRRILCGSKQQLGMFSDIISNGGIVREMMGIEWGRWWVDWGFAPSHETCIFYRPKWTFPQEWWRSHQNCAITHIEMGFSEETRSTVVSSYDSWITYTFVTNRMAILCNHWRG